MPRITINTEWCKGCYICVEACPHHVLEVDHDVFVRGLHPVVVARPDKCTRCLQCELLCPDLAIMVEDEQSEEQRVKVNDSKKMQDRKQ